MYLNPPTSWMPTISEHCIFGICSTCLKWYKSQSSHIVTGDANIRIATFKPYPKVRKKYVQSTYKVRILYVPQSVPRTRGVKIRKRGVLFRTKTRTKYVFPGFFGIVHFQWFLEKISALRNPNLKILFRFRFIRMYADPHWSQNHQLRSEPLLKECCIGPVWLCMGPMGRSGKTKMPSKIHSCSELQEGSKQLMEIKKEAEQQDELQKKIKDGGDAIICNFTVCRLTHLTVLIPEGLAQWHCCPMEGLRTANWATEVPRQQPSIFKQFGPLTFLMKIIHLTCYSWNCCFGFGLVS